VVLSIRLRRFDVDHAADGIGMTSAMAQGRAIGGMTMRVAGDVHTP
jgi:hypothetical protein